MIRKIIQYFALGCGKATMLITKAEYEKISFWDRIRLRYHNWACPPCKEWEDQNKVITSLTKKENRTHRLSDRKKIAMKKLLK